MIVKAHYFFKVLAVFAVCTLIFIEPWSSVLRNNPESQTRGNLELSFDVKLGPLPPKEAYDSISYFVFFIGYPRSGHSLIGSLLDAHPNVIIAHEYNILWLWDTEYAPEQRNNYYLYNELMKNSRNEVTNGDRSPKKPNFYTYFVPGQWQGRFDKELKVIGVKKGGTTTALLGSQHYQDVMMSINRSLKVPFKFIHVVRNPYDDVATMQLRAKCIRTTMAKDDVLDDPQSLEKQINLYSYLVRTNQMMLEKHGKDVLTLRSENIIKNPKESLMEMCTFLGLSCSQKYIEDCVRILYTKASQTRHNVVWQNRQKLRVQNLINKHPFLKDFSFVSD